MIRTQILQGLEEVFAFFLTNKTLILANNITIIIELNRSFTQKKRK